MFLVLNSHWSTLKCPKLIQCWSYIQSLTKKCVQVGCESKYPNKVKCNNSIFVTKSYTKPRYITRTKITGTIRRLFTMLKGVARKRKQKTSMIASYTFIWLSAESFRPVMSKTFTHVVIGRPYFLDAEGYKQFI